VDTRSQLLHILHRAKEEDALVVFTLVNIKMVQAMRHASTSLGLKVVDLWGNLLDEMDAHLDACRMCVSSL
jgi:[pyruvate, phosphate dikinase]-phosphate phosphotransferase / [pyruvate, phosphate dikinase] kinase